MSTSSKQCVLDNRKESIIGQLIKTSAQMKSLKDMVKKKQLVTKEDLAKGNDLLILTAVDGLSLENFTRYFLSTPSKLFSLILLLLGDVLIIKFRLPD